MTKSLFLASFLALGCSQIGTAQVTIPDPLVNLEFGAVNQSMDNQVNYFHASNSGAIANKGTSKDVSTVKPYVRNTIYANTIKDNNADAPYPYLGITDRDYRGVYYVTFDNNDLVGTAFANKVTWDFVFRLDKFEAGSPSSGTTKFLSCQQDGGWSFQYYPGNNGLAFDYITAAGSNWFCTNKKLETGKFYHVVATVDEANRLCSIYINGVATNIHNTGFYSTGDFKYPDIGSTSRTNGMWFDVGSDPKRGTTADGSENSARSTWAYVKVYGDALSESQCISLYNDNAKYYTEVSKPNTEDMIMDVQFGTSGSAKDASAYKADIVKVGSGASTAYNEGQGRYEATFTGVSGTTDFNIGTDYYYRDYKADPSVNASISDAFSIECYAKSDAAVPTHVYAPLSFQQNGGAGLQFDATGKVQFLCNLYGYPLDAVVGGTRCTSQWLTGTDKGTLTADYTHYVATYDKANCLIKLYINGVQSATTTIQSKNMGFAYSFSPYQFFCIGADPSSYGLCSLNDTGYPLLNTTGGKADMPFAGQISIARIWSKALTADDVTTLYAQAQNPETTITIGVTGYASTCLPYTAVVPTGVIAYKIASQDATTITLTQLATAGQAIPYATPVILKGAAGDYTFTKTNNDNAIVVTAPTDNLLEGTLATKTLGTDDEVYVLAASSGNTSKADMRPNAAGLTIPANKAYLPNTDGAIASKAFVINPNPSAISSVKAQNAENNIYYNIQGEKVEQPTRGIFILNGKKVFIK